MQTGEVGAPDPRRTPVASTVLVAARMSRQRRRDTAPEVAVRRVLFARGLRYRVNYPVPGMNRRTIDIAFTRAKIAVFLDGCYWHGCPIHGTRPRANAEWWASKLDRNQQRDAETSKYLATHAWIVLRFWEHDAVEHVVDTVSDQIAGITSPGARRPCLRDAVNARTR